MIEKTKRLLGGKTGKAMFDLVPSSDVVLGTLTDLKKAGARLEELRGELTQSEFAEKYGIHSNSLGRYERGERPMDIEFAARLCFDKDINPNWLLFGLMPKRGFKTLSTLPEEVYMRAVNQIADLTSSSPSHVDEQLRTGGPLGGKAEEPKAHYGHRDSEFVFLPLYRNVSVSAGNGAVVWDETEVDSIAFQDSFIRHELRANPTNLRLVRVTGDSMERLIYSGDIVMLDTSVDYLKGEGMYVFRIDEQIAVKWLYSLPGNVTRVVSENQEKYPPFEIGPDEAKSGRFKIIGLVRWWAHTQR